MTLTIRQKTASYSSRYRENDRYLKMRPGLNLVKIASFREYLSAECIRVLVKMNKDYHRPLQVWMGFLPTHIYWWARLEKILIFCIELMMMNNQQDYCCYSLQSNDETYHSSLLLASLSICLLHPRTCLIQMSKY